MTVSLDGFVQDAKGSAGALYPDLAELRDAPSIAPKRNERLYVTFITDGVGVALARAVEAAGERAVTVVGGADPTQQLLVAGLRLFDGSGPSR